MCPCQQSHVEEVGTEGSQGGGDVGWDWGFGWEGLGGVTWIDDEAFLLCVCWFVYMDSVCVCVCVCLGGYVYHAV